MILPRDDIAPKICVVASSENDRGTVLTLGRSVAPSQSGEPSPGPTVFLCVTWSLSAPSFPNRCRPFASAVRRTRSPRRPGRLHPRSSSCVPPVVPEIACPCCSVDAPKPPVPVAVARRLRSACRRLLFAPVAAGPHSSSSSGSGSSSSSSSSRSGRGSRARRSRRWPTRCSRSSCLALPGHGTTAYQAVAAETPEGTG
jgi:hypothetical protein